MTDNLLTYEEVMKLIGIRSRVTIMRHVQRGTLPPPLELSRGIVRFRESEILAWIDSRPLQRY